MTASSSLRALRSGGTGSPGPPWPGAAQQRPLAGAGRHHARLHGGLGAMGRPLAAPGPAPGAPPAARAPRRAAAPPPLVPPRAAAGGATPVGSYDGGEREPSELQRLINSIPYTRLCIWAGVVLALWPVHDFFGVRHFGGVAGGGWRVARMRAQPRARAAQA
jgi:hypothetical protein